MGRPLKIAKAQAILTITDTDATTEEVTVSQNLSTLGVIKGMPFIPASSTGGLTANTTYRYINQAVIASDLPNSGGAGNPIFVTTAGNFFSTSSSSLASSFVIPSSSSASSALFTMSS